MYKKRSSGWIKHIDFIIIDLLCLHVAFIFAYIMHFAGDTSEFGTNPYSEPDWVRFMAMMEILDFMFIIATNCFSNVLTRDWGIETRRSFEQAVSVEVLMTFALYVLKLGETYSRTVLLLTGFLYFVLTLLARMFWKHVLRSRYTDAGKRHLLVITKADNAKKLADSILDNNRDQYVISGIAVMDAKKQDADVGNYNVVADRESIVDYIHYNWVDEIYIDSSLEDEPYYTRLRNDIAKTGITLHTPIRTWDEEEGKEHILQKIGDKQVITSVINPVPAWKLLIKRLTDILGGIVGSIITIILTVFVAPAIYFSDPGPIFFTQTRVGENGKPFKIIKFRSMYKDAEAKKAELLAQSDVDDIMFKLKFDPRIIGCKKNEDGSIKKGIGNIIRDTSIDEFPQFFNVLMGNMSLVGTRPPTVDEWERYDLHHRARLAVKPGITGLWQVSGRSNVEDFEKVVAFDTEYINNWSLWLDFKILLKTVVVVFKREGAM